MNKFIYLYIYIYIFPDLFIFPFTYQLLGGKAKLITILLFPFTKKTHLLHVSISKLLNASIFGTQLYMP